MARRRKNNGFTILETPESISLILNPTTGQRLTVRMEGQKYQGMAIETAMTSVMHNGKMRVDDQPKATVVPFLAPSTVNAIPRAVEALMSRVAARVEGRPSSP